MHKFALGNNFAIVREFEDHNGTTYREMISESFASNAEAKTFAANRWPRHVVWYTVDLKSSGSVLAYGE